MGGCSHKTSARTEIQRHASILTELRQRLQRQCQNEKSMKPQSIASSQECVGNHTKSPLKSQIASPTCVSQITTGGKPKVTWRENKIWMFPVNSNFPVTHTRELTHGKIKKSDATSQPYNFPVPSKGQTKAGSELE